MTAAEVDPRVVAHPIQAALLITVVSDVGDYDRARGRWLVGLLASRYGVPPWGSRRAVRARLQAAPAWLGRLTFHRTFPAVGRKWTGSGEVRDRRGVRNRDGGGDAGGAPVSAHDGDVEGWQEVPWCRRGRPAVLHRAAWPVGLLHLRPCLARGPRACLASAVAAASAGASKLSGAARVRPARSSRTRLCGSVCPGMGRAVYWWAYSGQGVPSTSTGPRPVSVRSRCTAAAICSPTFELPR